MNPYECCIKASVKPHYRYQHGSKQQHCVPLNSISTAEDHCTNSRSQLCTSMSSHNSQEIHICHQIHVLNCSSAYGTSQISLWYDMISASTLSVRHQKIIQSLKGWLEFNGTFSTKRLYRALQKLKFVKSFISFKKLKIYCLGALIKMWESWECWWYFSITCLYTVHVVKMFSTVKRHLQWSQVEGCSLLRKYE